MLLRPTLDSALFNTLDSLRDYTFHYYKLLSLHVGICRQFIMSDMTRFGTIAVLYTSFFFLSQGLVFPDMIVDRLCLEV